jgi:hypothetical protein
MNGFGDLRHISKTLHCAPLGFDIFVFSFYGYSQSEVSLRHSVA